LGIIGTWDSKWYSEKEYAQWLHEDLKIQKFVTDSLSRAGISRVEVERVGDRCKINVHTARPGIVIGRRGSEAEKLQADLEKLVGRTIRIEVTEVARPELDAQLVAETIAAQIERRSNFRSAMKKNIAASMKAGAQGVKIAISGRLGGHEMARSEFSSEGRVPLHTLRANIDYGFKEATTTYGKIGVKTWIFIREVIGKQPLPEMPTTGRVAEVPAAGGERHRQPRRREERFEADRSDRSPRRGGRGDGQRGGRGGGYRGGRGGGRGDGRR
jgi:small subunit ribosomal protein S3